MMRSLYSGISGLRVHQTRMDVIGANIANVNTVGFKSSRVTFRDVLYQSVSYPTKPSEADPMRGGTNPGQIGLGTMIGSIDVLSTRAGPMLTDKPTDVYLDGEGYFIVRDQNDPPNYFYTRVGDFRFDSLGRLTDGAGNIVMGKLAPSEPIPPEGTPDYEELEALSLMDAEGIDGDPEIWNRLTQFSIGQNGEITAYDPYNEEDPIVTLGYLAIAKFVNPEGMNQAGTSYWTPTTNSGPVTFFSAGSSVGKTIANRLEMSNVELAKEFTDMIVTERGFQANTRIITVSDEMLQELVNLKR